MSYKLGFMLVLYIRQMYDCVFRCSVVKVLYLLSTADCLCCFARASLDILAYFVSFCQYLFLFFIGIGFSFENRRKLLVLRLFSAEKEGFEPSRRY